MPEKKGVYIKCLVCNEDVYLKKSRAERTENHFCSTKCLYEYKTIETIEKYEERLNCNLEKWLYEKYVIEKNSGKKITELMGTKNNRLVSKLLKRFNIEQRSLSESVRVEFETSKNKENRSKVLRERAKKNLNKKEAREKLKKIMQTTEYKTKMSKANKGENNGMYGRLGIKCPNYNHDLKPEDRIGRRNLEGYTRWRNGVYERDNYTCLCCHDSKGGNLVAHHLESYNNNKALRLEVSNGVTLCEDCHKEFHGIYGYGNNTKLQFNEFIERKSALTM